ncbi:MAG: hypothetical protein R3A80_01490 [Bdellovibrionota bacterium]
MNPKLMHLKRIDEKILRLWVEADGKLNHDSTGLFLALLEKRVQLLKVLREAGERLHPEVCVPQWLEKFTRGTQSFSLRDLKIALAETEKELDNPTQ